MILTSRIDPNNPHKLIEVKTTANKYAKELLIHAMESSFYFDEHGINIEKMTDKEKEQVRIALNKKYNAVRKYLNI